MTIAECDGRLIPETVAAALDLAAWYHRAFSPPDYETRCYLLAEKRAAECKTAEQRRIVERDRPTPANPSRKAQK